MVNIGSDVKSLAQAKARREDVCFSLLLPTQLVSHPPIPNLKKDQGHLLLLKNGSRHGGLVGTTELVLEHGLMISSSHSSRRCMYKPQPQVCGAGATAEAIARTPCSRP